MIDAIHNLPWPSIQQALDEKGFAHIPSVLDPTTCKRLADQYSNSNLYRSTISMERYRFGKGEYKYFTYPLPDILQSLRETFYQHLSLLANRWMAKLNQSITYPDNLNALLDQCHKAGQLRPTPLILHYEKDGFNTLHQDLYGDVFFPFQVVIMLSQHGADYQGGELVFVEQVPRAQSKAAVMVPSLGDAIIFTTNFRPAKSSRGYYQARMKHGVSTVTSGERFALGLIFHDAR